MGKLAQRFIKLDTTSDGVNIAVVPDAAEVWGGFLPAVGENGRHDVGRAFDAELDLPADAADGEVVVARAGPHDVAARARIRFFENSGEALGGNGQSLFEREAPLVQRPSARRQQRDGLARRGLQRDQLPDNFF